METHETKQIIWQKNWRNIWQSIFDGVERLCSSVSRIKKEQFLSTASGSIKLILIKWDKDGIIEIKNDNVKKVACSRFGGNQSYLKKAQIIQSYNKICAHCGGTKFSL